MSTFSRFILNTRLWAIVCLGALGLTVALSLFGHLAGPRLWGATPEDARATGQFMLPVFFGLFVALGFCALPLITNLLVAGLERTWSNAGLLESPRNARFLARLHRHHVRIVVVMWGLFLMGLIAAAPHAVRDWILEQGSPAPAADGRGAPNGKASPQRR